MGANRPGLSCSVFVLVICLLKGTFAWAQHRAPTDFTVRPYLQLGDKAKASSLENLDVIWFAPTNSDKWQIYMKRQGTEDWREQGAPACQSVVAPMKTYRFSGKISGLLPGSPFQYRLLKNGKLVFQARGTTRKSNLEPYRIVLFGDMGANTDAQRKVAYRIFQKKPDALVFLGDIVYDYGTFSEYLEEFFPIYNAAKASPTSGAPLLQSTPGIAILGNHDVALGDYKVGVNLDKYPDGLGYYTVWSQPLNGPLTDRTGPNVPKLAGSKENISRYLEAAGQRYPRMSNFSFDYGNSHWLVLDANPYMDWTNAALRNWVTKDLAGASSAKWKFVCCHQAPFSFDVSHYKEQRMRLLCDIFEKEGVDVVFCGHAHDYQRSFPLTFEIQKENGKPHINEDGTIDGNFHLDKSFDGVKNTNPKGIIYIVSGAGGAKLYPSVKDTMPWVDGVFTDKFIGDTHSFTVCDVSAGHLDLKQISEDGVLLDHITISKQKQKTQDSRSQTGLSSVGTSRSTK
jgi:predicted MPP superfamily phosphohydrolase